MNTNNPISNTVLVNPNKAALKEAAKQALTMVDGAVQDAIDSTLDNGTIGAPAHKIINSARTETETAVLAGMAGVTVVDNDAVEFRVIELVYCPLETEIGTFAGFESAAPGTVGNALDEKHIRVREEVMLKHCVAQYVPGLCASVVLVRVPGFKLDGSPLFAEEREQIIRGYLRANNRTQVWTQSSIKPSGTDRSVLLYTVPTAVADVLMAGLTITQAANYWPLIFSETDSRVGFKVSMTVGEPTDGADGNCPVNPTIAPRNCQFRAVEIVGKGKVVAHKDGTFSVVGKLQIAAIAKGTMYPVASAGAPCFDTNQVKFGGIGDHTFIVLRNNGVEAAESTSPAWASAMLGMNIRDTKEVRAWVKANVSAEVLRLFNLLLPENRSDLISRWGGVSFEDGELVRAKNTALDMLTADMPFHSGMADVLGRLAVSEIVEGIIPSLGVRARRSLIVMSAKHGLGTCKAEDAKTVFFGMPVLEPGDFFAMPKSAFKAKQGMVIQPAIAELGGRDSDGDSGYEINGDHAKMVLANLLTGIAPAIKPSKRKDMVPVSERALFLKGCEVISQSHFVGSATIGYWKCTQELNRALNAGDAKAAKQWADVAGKYAWAAKTAPMLTKHIIEVDGMSFGAWYNNFNRANYETLKGITLAWRDAQSKAAEWKSPRELAKAHIENPVSLIDYAWNCACDVAAEWVKANPLVDFSPTEVAFTAMDRFADGISFGAKANAREMANRWNGHWHMTPAERGGKAGDKAMRDSVVAWFRNATTEEVAAAVSMRTKDGGAMWGFKVNAAKAGRMTECLGLHPQLAASLKKRYPQLAKMDGFKLVTEVVK